MQIEVSSFFSPGHWKKTDLETFKRVARPEDESELAEMLNALEAGYCVLSVLGTLKFRAAPKEENRADEG